MFPTKLKALNASTSDESSDDEEAPVKITKEALETKAELQYSQALQFLARDKLDEAEDELFKLLQSEIISSLNTTLNQKDSSKSVLTHLKYCCLTNLGNILANKSNYQKALIYYQEALLMDNTDLNLWYKIGLTHSKMYQTDQAISAFLEGLKCNPHHWPSLDNLITLLFASNEYICCLHYISITLNLDPEYLKGHFIKEIIYNKFPSLVSYFKSYCPNGGLDVKCTEEIDEDIKQRILKEINNIKTNDTCLGLNKISRSNECSLIIYAKISDFKNFCNLGKWLLNIYNNLFENHDHLLLYQVIKFYDETSEQIDSDNYLKLDIMKGDNFDNPLFKHEVNTTKRRKSSPSLADQLKLSRRSARNKANNKVNESSLAKTVWDIIPEHLGFNKDGSDKMTLTSIKWSDDSMDTMDLYRLYEFSDVLSDGQTENLLKNNLSDEERQKLINKEGFFGTDLEKEEVISFLKMNENKSISDLLQIYLTFITFKWNYAWPLDLITIYIDLFKRVWIHTETQNIISINKTDLYLLDNEKITKVKNDIISVLTYGELLCDLYFQLRLDHKPLEGSILGGEFCTLWMGDIDDILSMLDLKEDHESITIRFYWLQALFHLQEKEIGLTCDVLNTLSSILNNYEDYEIVIPNIEYFYRINKKIVEKLIITLKRNKILSTVKDLYEAQDFNTVTEILKETLKSQSRTTIEIPNYQTMTRLNQYIYLLKSFFELKNYNELFKWCEPCLYEAILQHRKSLIEECDSIQKTSQAEFINNIFNAMLESIRIVGLQIFDDLPHGFKSRLLQSVINLLSYLIETVEGNPEIDAISPWLLIYNLLKHEESRESSVSLQVSSIPQSLSLLILGHEYLGKRSWCCFEDGVLLYLILCEIEPYIHLDIYTETLAQHVEQIFQCLYTNLMKRNNKPRGVQLQQHNSMGLALTWPRARQLAYFHQPIELPTFDGVYKFFSVNCDTEIIFKKVIALIPNEIKPDRYLDTLMEFIRGESNNLPANDNPLPKDVEHVFYLLADYNFKNKNWNKAIRYYLLDLCNKINRFDSWAAMALARGSQIETKLNSCESIKNEGDIIRRAHMTGRCYKHSLKINPENTTLLIEYGTFTYSIHSYCSRLLKQETSSMSLQMFGELEKEKEKMIKVARKCFESANNVWEYTDCDAQDERWVHHYILGKIAEKSDDNPSIFMKHYLKAIEYLDSYGAKYPDHIQYTTPLLYSIEVLEIFYRMHAGTLKLLEKYDNNSLNEELLIEIEKALDQISNSSPVCNKNNKSNFQFSNCKINDAEELDIVVKQTLDCILNEIFEFKKIENTHYIIKTSYKASKCLNQERNNLTFNEKYLEFPIVQEDMLVPIKKIKLDCIQGNNHLSQLHLKLIQRCINALEDCIKRFPQHYKSYYRLAHFYFRSSTHKNFTKCKELLLGSRGLFAGQKNHNFFQGIWRIPVCEIDRPGSFAYHMSRCIHLLLDFLKETGDYKSLLDLAIQLKNIPEPEKKYLRDDEREGISKEALFLSIQILRKLKLENSKFNNQSKNELLLVEVYKIYKKVMKHWQQKENTISLSKLLLNIYQNILGTKEEVSIDVIIKHAQKLDKQKETGKVICSTTAQSKSAAKPESLQTSTPLPPKSQKRSFHPDPSSSIPYYQDLSNQLLSFMSSLQNPNKCPSPIQLSNSDITLQQKLQATKQKLKRNHKQKHFVSINKSPINNLLEQPNINAFQYEKSKKNLNINYGESKFVQNFKSRELDINYTPQSSKNINTSKINESKISPHFNSTIELEVGRKLSCVRSNKLSKGQSLEKSKFNSVINYEKIRPVEFNQINNVHEKNFIKGKVKQSNLVKPNSVYIDLDSAAEQARLQSNVFQNKIEMKNTPISLNPATLLSSCPGLSITPVLNSNDNINIHKGPHYSNSIPSSQNFNFQQAIQQLGKNLTITKTEKNSNNGNKSISEIIFID